MSSTAAGTIAVSGAASASSAKNLRRYEQRTQRYAMFHLGKSKKEIKKAAAAGRQLKPVGQFAEELASAIRKIRDLMVSTRSLKAGEFLSAGLDAAGKPVPAIVGQDGTNYGTFTEAKKLLTKTANFIAAALPQYIIWTASKLPRVGVQRSFPYLIASPQLIAYFNSVFGADFANSTPLLASQRIALRQTVVNLMFASFYRLEYAARQGNAEANAAFVTITQPDANGKARQKTFLNKNAAVFAPLAQAFLPGSKIVLTNDALFARQDVQRLVSALSMSSKDALEKRDKNNVVTAPAATIEVVYDGRSYVVGVNNLLTALTRLKLGKPITGDEDTTRVFTAFFNETERDFRGSEALNNQIKAVVRPPVVGRAEQAAF